MAQYEAAITLELEPLVKLICKAVNCKNNLMQTQARQAACNLKHLTISKAGQCEKYEPYGEPEVGNAD